jgi:hypothetical protein
MTNNKIQLWISPTEGKVYSSLNPSSDPPALEFVQGDDVEVELHLCKKIEDNLVEIDFPASAQVKLAVGKKDTGPEQGTYRIGYGSEFATLAFDAASTAIQTALNAMVGIANAGGVSVVRLSAALVQIKFLNTGTNGSFTVNADGLLPTSYGKFVTIRAGNSTNRGTYFLKVAQSPIVYQTEWDSVASVEPVVSTVTTIGLGHKRIELSPVPTLGSWSITSTPNVWRSWRLQPDFGTPSQVTPATTWGLSETLVIPAVAVDEDFQYTANTIDVTDEKMFDISDYLQPTVKRVSDGIYDVIWNASTWLPPDATYYPVVADYTTPPVGYAYPLSVNTAGLKPRKGLTAKLNLNSAEVEYFLAGAASATAELEVEVAADGARQTVLMTECTIKNDMIDGYAYSPIELDLATIPDAPSDGVFYGRKDGGWTPLTEIDGGSY